ncbi:TIM barrel protein [Campylobacter sp. CX2-8023-23]|uniref:TIM barrel protein n=1 Tax=Campylobacter porcelli TaxID=1660073 RepID=A0ABU7M5C1_9BACT|nr:TIM barrel protein [Campylobacter sp. CX2-8023-23]MEE3744926.1 TIM barrel protein [Campylobacter sp. CX2-4855-23]
MSYKIGLKLWSLNENYISPAKELFERGVYDYIELYAVPNSLDMIAKWKSLARNCGVKFAIHAPHFSSGLDFSNPNKLNYNLNLCEEVKIYSNELEALYTIFHPGIGGELLESIRQMKMIKDLKFAIENKPYIVPMEGGTAFCVGADFDSIKRILDEVGCDFCLDAGHALCSANFQGLNPYEYIAKLNELNPRIYHISDNNVESKFDAHLHFGDGNIELDRVLSLLVGGEFLAIETIKDSKENLDDFIKDSNYLKNIIANFNDKAL